MRFSEKPAKVLSLGRDPAASRYLGTVSRQGAEGARRPKEGVSVSLFWGVGAPRARRTEVKGRLGGGVRVGL